MEFRILGPLEVEEDGRVLQLGGAQQLALLALLLLHANEAVARDRLIEELWDGRPPDTAATAIQVHVSQLRKVLGRDVIVTQRPGYVIRLADGELDLRRFEETVARARSAAPAEAAVLLAEALALWRGVPFAEVEAPFARTARARLEEQRLAALEQRIDADLELGRHTELVAELEQLVQEHPLRERLRGQLMLVLYRCGRQADALAVYQEGRRTLAEELGLEPGEDLRRLERAILAQDESLSAAAGLAATRLPTGTVTFLFTDIEGSTRLERELGAAQYADALTEHRRLLRDAFARHDGVEIDTQGDAFFVAFPTAPGALGAAAEAQAVLAGGPVRVRMGLHTGTPLASGDGYVGVDVHRAARIAASGHGGQVLVSASTAALVGADGLRDLGEHRLKDLSAPERIYQLGDGDFPPLKSLGRTNLPIPATPFLGREGELDEVQELVSRADVRLLTLTGPGGTGKTRLALQAVAAASERYLDGVFWVPLAPLRDAGLVLETAGRALGARNGLAEHIGDARILLLFDNFEHVVEAAADLAGLLAVCPRLDLLVTSREPLHVTGEQEYPVPSLAPAEAVDFFLARARAIKPEFRADDAVAEICRRLDDLPLALELAAARTKALSPAQIRDRLEQRLPLLTGGARDAPERQQTLRATIEWSYDLLADEEKSLFARLAVFRGGCTLDEAEEVVGASLDVLQSLVDKSLLRHTEERFWMLETIREYAVERLELQGDGDSLRQRHADYFLRLAEEAEPHLTGSEQAPWLERLEAEHDNFRLALDSLRRADRGDEELRLVGALMRFWYVHGHLHEGSSRCEEALAAHDDQSVARVKALFGATLLSHRLGNYERSLVLGEERLELARRLGDTEGEASSLVGLGLASHALDDNERAAALWRESAELARAEGFTWILAVATNNLGSLAQGLGDNAQATACFEESLTLFRQIGDQRMATGSLIDLGSLAAREGRNDEAEALLRESLEGARALLDRELAIWCLEELAGLAVSKGDAVRAGTLTGVLETLREETGHVPQPDERLLNERTRLALASILGEEQVSAAAAVGREMTFEQAVAYALESQAP